MPQMNLLNLTLVCLFSFLVVHSPLSATEYWVAQTQKSFVMLVLEKNHRARYLHYELMPDGSPPYFVEDAKAEWGVYVDTPKVTHVVGNMLGKKGDRKFWVATKQFKMSYIQPNQDTVMEVDKTGVQRKFISVKNNDGK